MRWHKLPDWMIIFLYTITQPIIHNKKKPGKCRMPELCIAYSYVINKESLSE